MCANAPKMETIESLNSIFDVFQFQVNHRLSNVNRYKTEYLSFCRYSCQASKKHIDAGKIICLPDYIITLPVAERRPGYTFLAVTVDSHPASPKPVLCSVVDLGLVKKSGSLIEIHLDQARVREVGYLKPVGGVVFPAI